MKKLTTFLILLTFTIGCGGSSRKVSASANNFQGTAKTIQSTKGDAQGTAYTGEFQVAIVSGRVDCSTKKSGSGGEKTKAGEGDVLKCTQDNGTLSCVYKKDTLSGYLMKDGTFGLLGALDLGLPDDVAASTTGLMNGKFATPESGSAKVELLLKASKGSDQATCTAQWNVNLNRVKATAQNQVTAPASASLRLSYETEVSEGTRVFDDVRLKSVEDGGVAVGAKGSSGERVVGEFKPNGETNVSVSLTDAGGVPMNEQVSDCSHERQYAPGGTRISFDCSDSKISGSFVVPHQSL